MSSNIFDGNKRNYFLLCCRKSERLQLNKANNLRDVNTKNVNTDDDTVVINANVVKNIDEVKSGKCFFCGEETHNTCHFCDNIFFCSQVHTFHS